MTLDGKVALVTGASRGIGKAIALLLAQRGAYVIVNDINDKTDADKVVAEIEEKGGKAMAAYADVSSVEEVEEMFNKIEEKAGKVSILVNNAGITRDTLLMRMKEEDWDAVIRVNLKSMYVCTKAAIRGMIKLKKGSIINISSVVGLVGQPGQANYAAAKAGALGFTRTMARELGSRQIRVNAIAPGFILTNMTESLGDEFRAEYAQQIPLQRMGLPEDVAKAVAFLASDEADYITGQVLNVDGGMVR